MPHDGHSSQLKVRAVAEANFRLRFAERSKIRLAFVALFQREGQFSSVPARGTRRQTRKSGSAQAEPVAKRFRARSARAEDRLSSSKTELRSRGDGWKVFARAFRALAARAEAAQSQLPKAETARRGVLEQAARTGNSSGSLPLCAPPSWKRNWRGSKAV